MYNWRELCRHMPHNDIQKKPHSLRLLCTQTYNNILWICTASRVLCSLSFCFNIHWVICKHGAFFLISFIAWFYEYCASYIKRNTSILFFKLTQFQGICNGMQFFVKDLRFSDSFHPIPSRNLISLLNICFGTG